jgi:HNH endonuclease
MSTLNNSYKVFLKKLTKEVQARIVEKIDDERIVSFSTVIIGKSNTCGFNVDVFKFRGIEGRGRIEMWLDMWSNVGRPILAVCFWSADISKIDKLVLCKMESFRDDHPTGWEKTSNSWHLTIPLAQKYFEKFLVEPCGSYWLSYYFKDSIIPTNDLSETLVSRVVRRTEWLIMAVLDSLGKKEQNNEDYSKVENRQLVVTHLKRERSKSLLLLAKKRDKYICQVCDFNFEQFYGKIGKNFAEAHHKVSLASLKVNVETKLGDLITVCSNCHRMLHKMEGKRNDYMTLRRLITNKGSE